MSFARGADVGKIIVVFNAVQGAENIYPGYPTTVIVAIHFDGFYYRNAIVLGAIVEPIAGKQFGGKDGKLGTVFHRLYIAVISGTTRIVIKRSINVNALRVAAV